MGLVVSTHAPLLSFRPGHAMGASGLREGQGLMGRHSQDNDEDGYWPKPVPEEDRGEDDGKHSTGQQQDEHDDKK